MTINFSPQFATHVSDKDQRQALRDVVSALASAAIEIAGICAHGPLEEGLGAETGSENSDGDNQKALDVRSDEIVTARLRTAPVAYYASEEQDIIVTLDEAASLAVASDPLDGSSNIDTNVSIGTIFSVYEAVSGDPEASFFRPGTDQIAGGFFVYGPQTTLVITTGKGTELYVLEPGSGTFKLAIAQMEIPKASAEFAINASNFQHWDSPVRAYIEDCLKGEDGPFGKKHGMRWVGSLVADANRILMRGGIFLYPSDNRKGYEAGRLRLLYEANPVAFVIEQAGGTATDGEARIMEKTLTELHQRVPFVFGSSENITLVENYHQKSDAKSTQSPLFNQRGLLR